MVSLFALRVRNYAERRGDRYQFEEKNNHSSLHRTSLGGLFGRALEEVEGCGGFGGNRVGSFFELVGDFEDAGSVRGECGDVSGYVLPVDVQTSGAAAVGPQVIVFDAVIVVEVEFGDAGLEEFEGFVDAKVGLAVGGGTG